MNSESFSFTFSSMFAKYFIWISNALAACSSPNKKRNKKSMRDKKEVESMTHSEARRKTSDEIKYKTKRNEWEDDKMCLCSGWV